MTLSSKCAGAIRRIVPARIRPIGYLTHLVRRRTGCQVTGGPFVGMKYIETSTGSAYLPKLLGMYERELNPCVEALCARRLALVVDVGAAEGYYAVGLARRLPATRVTAFEMEANGQRQLAAMARLNEVADQVEVRGRCEPADLQEALRVADGDAAVVCDVEGYERELLDPAAVPALRQAAILVELHDFIVPGVTELLVERFGVTHDIQHIWQQERRRDEFPWTTVGTRLLPRRYLDWAVSEWRPVRMAWLWMTPK